MIDVLLSDQPLSLDAAYAAVVDPTCGGIVLFVGTIRNHNKGQTVTHLNFDAYEPMALREMKRIGEAAATQFHLAHVSLHHRTSALAIGDIAVIIAVSSHHRKAAFTGCEYIIDELKQHVPIWKHEYLEDGSYWVNARP